MAEYHAYPHGPAHAPTDIICIIARQWKVGLGLPKFSSVWFSAIFAKLRTKLNGSELVHSCLVWFSSQFKLGEPRFFSFSMYSKFSIYHELFLVLHENHHQHVHQSSEICRHV